MSMDTLWYVTNTLINIASLCVNAFLITRFYRPYIEKRWKSAGVGIIYLCTMLILYFIPIVMQGITAFSIGLFAVMLSAVILDYRNIPQKIFLGMTAYLLRWFAAWLALLPWDMIYTLTVLNPTLYGRISAQLMAFAVISIIKEIIANLLLFAAFLFVNRVYEDKTEEMKGKEAILLLSSYLPIMIGYWFSAYVSNIYMQDTNADIWDKHRFYNIFLGVFQVISYLVILTVIFSYQKIRKAEKEATLNAVAVSQIDELKRHLSSVEKLYDDMRSIRHDMSGHLMVLEGLYKKGEVQSADKYLINCQNELSKVTKWERTGNPVTDTLLTEKRNEAERKGIRFESDLEFSDKWGIEVFDISIMLSNALTNAIEAADTETPYISICGKRNKNIYILEVRNSYGGFLKINKNSGFPDTDKDDRLHHGFGLLNIKRAAEKYLGTVALMQEGQTVILTCMLQLKSFDT